ncbi:hypothetical protein B0F90DRAFT_1702996 [Multifurca ochricompacta]|uniref:Uncharacterized protein n=1 Tax=Multifurca ochricompacta TaxID=376703 RepID=A0AAD4M7I6_9AGAM|nr:hypothetical protein B0F90DRAFT_1702996 [Multifurca ochricompacta]
MVRSKACDLTGAPTMDKIAALTTFIISAIHDISPRHDLKDVLLSIEKDSLQADLDALGLLPHLLSCPRDGADQLLSLIAQYCSAKEVIMGVQEVVERLRTESGEEVDGSSEEVSLVVQVIRLMLLLKKAFPRLVPRKSPSQTLAWLAELEQLMSLVTTQATVAESRSLVRNAALLVQELGAWVRGKAGSNITELTTSYTFLTSFLDVTLESCADLLQSYVAQREFEICFPRLSYRSIIPGDWQDGQDVVLLSLDVSSSLGRSFDTLQSNPTLASMVLIAHAHALPPIHFNLSLLVSILPVILTSLHSNIALDASLAILLKVLCAAPLTHGELSSDFIIPLTTVLPWLCSAHPDASTRHITLRILSQVLHLTPSVLRLQILRDLLSPSEYLSPYMRVTAIGLVKEAILDTIGPYVFRLDLDSPHTLASITGVDAFDDSPEPARLVECLGLYYILLLRDVDNRTGIRDLGTVQSIESSLLRPIRSVLSKWARDFEVLPSTAAALQISLERVDDALRTIAGAFVPSGDVRVPVPTFK